MRGRKVIREESFKKLNLLSSIIFFFDVFLALIIIGTASYLVQTELGKVSLAFGFIMLSFSVMLRIVKKW
jgi:hypothetical membrane protein